MSEPEPKKHILGLKSDRQKRFLQRFAECGRHDLAAKIIGVDRKAHYRWLKEDEEYREAYAQARVLAVDMLEAEAWRRAREGVVRKKFGKDGAPIIDPETGVQYVEREYSDHLLIHLLRGLRPEVYRERYEHKHDVRVHQKVIVLGEVHMTKPEPVEQGMLPER